MIFMNGVMLSDKILLKLIFLRFGVSGWPGHLFFNQPELEEYIGYCLPQPAIPSASIMEMKPLGLTEFDEHVELIVKDQDGEEISGYCPICCRL